MMTANRLVNYVTAEPFWPFRIKMAGGETFEIRHPEMVQVGRTTATIFTWMSADGKDHKEREREISIILIESIEPFRDNAKPDPELDRMTPPPARRQTPARLSEEV